MTTEEKRRWTALAGIRAAIKGWAFAADDKIHLYVKHADERKAKLTPDLQPYAEELIAPLREYLSKFKK